MDSAPFELSVKLRGDLADDGPVGRREGTWPRVITLCLLTRGRRGQLAAASTTNDRTDRRSYLPSTHDVEHDEVAESTARASGSQAAAVAARATAHAWCRDGREWVKLRLKEILRLLAKKTA